jgi:hypothetical protein
VNSKEKADSEIWNEIAQSAIDFEYKLKLFRRLRQDNHLKYNIQLTLDFFIHNKKGNDSNAKKIDTIC